MSLKHSRDLYFLLGILVKHFSFLLCNLRKGTLGGKNKIVQFYSKYPIKYLSVRSQWIFAAKTAPSPLQGDTL